jgi:hypothetical protein
MDSFLYNFDTVIIVAVLFVFMVIGIEVGYRLGRRAQKLMVELTKSQINAIQASMLALLALILGFTFSLSLQRFDDRANAVVDEANAIGTTYLRTYLLPDSVRAEAQKLTREYVDYRLKTGSISLDEADQRSSVIMESDSKLGELWRLTAKAAREDGGPVTSGLFITSLNETIDSFGARDAIVKRHVPELVILLLFATFILTGVVIGYANGAEDHRPSIAAHVLALLIALLVFIIIDLDRPRRGLIHVPQESIMTTHEWITADVDK